MILESQEPVNRDYILTGTIEESNVKEIMETISKLNFEDSLMEETLKEFERDAILIRINTYGGSVYDTLALYDCIRNSTTPIVTYGTGKVMSGGLYILLAGNRRLASKYTTFMHHELSSGTFDKLEGMKQDIKEMEKLQTEILDKIILERTNITQDKLESVRSMKHDWYFDSNEAKKLGIIEEVV